MSQNALRYTRRGVRTLATDLGEVFDRAITSRREAQDKMIDMIREVERQALEQHRTAGLFGEDYYIVHNTRYFKVYRKGYGVTTTDKLVLVLAMFTPEAFVHGFATINH